ncbi:amidohydrolase family protein [Kibdelosporangium aridum]|uniref:amidohydrolase family protein n=1 Tax=Kibdelosporangium aridum TaxID=2030 RepID=UPI0005641F65|nr:amidohydrolase family protein [Kibdelosporangium aridum]
MIIENVRVFDGEHVGGPYDVATQDGVITQIRPAHRRPDRPDDVVDGSGATLLPGLIDAHAHVCTTESNLELALAFGVTTLLDMFEFPPDRLTALRTAAAERNDLADLRSAGTLVSATDGLPGVRIPWIPTIAHPDQADEFVAGRRDEGSDYIKIVIDDGASHGQTLPALDRATVAAVVSAAHRRGLSTVAHISGVWSVEVALDAGVDILTHLPLEAPLGRDLVRRAADDRRVVVPTLTMMEMCATERGRGLADDPRVSGYLPEHAHAAIAHGQVGLPVALGKRDFAHALASARALSEAGVPLLAGTDANNAPGRDAPVVNGASMHRELELLVEAGLTARAALAAATSAPARYFGLADRGRIAPGMRADLLLVRGDPTEDITATRSILGVWRRGVRFDREGFRRRLVRDTEGTRR